MNETLHETSKPAINRTRLLALVAFLTAATAAWAARAGAGDHRE